MIIDRGLSSHQSREINHLVGGRSFGEGQGFFTAFGLDLGIKSAAGLIRQFIEDVDKTPPTLTIVQPAATTYPHSGTLTLNYSSATDDESGVKSVTPTLDGETSVGGHGLRAAR